MFRLMRLLVALLLPTTALAQSGDSPTFRALNPIDMPSPVSQAWGHVSHGGLTDLHGTGLYITFDEGPQTFTAYCDMTVPSPTTRPGHHPVTDRLVATSQSIPIEGGANKGLTRIQLYAQSKAHDCVPTGD